jgi:hypothetical protein
MGKPVIVVADDEASLRALAGELEARYRAHCRLSASPGDAHAATAWHRLSRQYQGHSGALSPQP